MTVATEYFPAICVAAFWLGMWVGYLMFKSTAYRGMMQGMEASVQKAKDERAAKEACKPPPPTIHTVQQGVAAVLDELRRQAERNERERDL